MFPEHLRLQIKESDTALSNPKVKITFELDERASEIFQRRLHISECQDITSVLGELCLINHELRAYQHNKSSNEVSHIPLFYIIPADPL